ncbi:MAG: DUF72 domain-containing protein [Polyangiales bacterium]
MTTFHIGCAGFAAPRERYLSRLSFVEFALRQPLPSPKVLATWRKHTPESFTYGLVAPASFYGDPSWPLRDPAAVRSETDRLLNLADALGAGALVFRTPMAVSPGSVALGRMAPVFERARKALDVVAWDPAGLWERDAAAEHAEKFGVLTACDPLHDEVDEPVVYARMRGLGFDNKYHSGRLEELAEALAGCEEAFVVFESGGAWREALKFAGIAAGAGASAFLDGEEGEDGDDDEDDDEDGEAEGDEDDDEGAR